jgi:hypothetical protein
MLPGVLSRARTCREAPKDAIGAGARTPAGVLKPAVTGEPAAGGEDAVLIHRSPSKANSEPPSASPSAATKDRFTRGRWSNDSPVAGRSNETVDGSRWSHADCHILRSGSFVTHHRTDLE